MIEGLDEQVDKIYEQIQKPYREMARSIKTMTRTMVGGSLVFAISMLSMKCDNTKNYMDLRERTERNARGIERVEQEGYKMVKPCYIEREAYTEVSSC